MIPFAHPRLQQILRLMLASALLFVGSACAATQAATTAPIAATPSVSATLPPSPTPTVPPTPTATLIPSATPLPTLTPTPTAIPYFITATVWITDPVIPILTYHQFAPDYAPHSTAVKVRLADFRAHLQSLYDAGYSLVPLQDWLNGDLHAPAGRRPLIFTMDDLFFNNQITLLDDGNPSPESGIGLLWQFYQEHPDFGFSGALFACLGDKLYANPDDPDWEDKLAQAIVWVIEHDLIPYNHFYTHPRLNELSARDVIWQAQMNDKYLRQLLEKANRAELTARLGNIFALTYGVWPTSDGTKALLAYQTPEGWAVQAVMEVDYIYRPKFMLPPYDPAFDRFHVPRMVGTQGAIDYLVEHQADFPAAQVCRLGPLDTARLDDAHYLGEQAALAAQRGACSYGIFALPGYVFRIETGRVSQLLPAVGQ